jgi:sensory rhodopsin
MATSTIWFGIASVLFGATMVWYLYFAVRRGDLSSPYYFLPPVHVLVAGTSYLAMAIATSGLVPLPVGDELVVNAFRHLDWAVSTPIITYYLAMLANARTSVRVGAVVANVLMIASGYVATAVPGLLTWVFFGFSSICFLALMYVFVQMLGRAIDENPRSSRSVFLSLRDLTVAIWTLYPLVFVLGPSGLGLLQFVDHNFVTAMLDLTAKVGFMIVMVTRQYELNNFVTAETTAAQSGTGSGSSA